jgi:hypothetical protein
MSYYFVRVNGKTGHNNPSIPNAYVPKEPPVWPKSNFNYYESCLKNGFIRIGWPDVGDLKKGDKAGALANFYSLESVKPHIKKYLLDFSHIPLKSVVLMPNKDVPGNLYIGEVSGPYNYYHDVPKAPYECSHRLAVNWDRDINGSPVLYHAEDINIGIIGGWWLRAFYEISDAKITDVIDKVRDSLKC